MNADKYRAYCSQLIRNPDDATALIDQYSVISENKTQAAQHLPLARRAYDLAPNNVAAVFNCGTALHRVGRFRESVALYQRALGLGDPEWTARIYHHLGIGYRAMGENHNAAHYYLKAYELTGDPGVMKDRALAVLASGKLKEGLELFEVRKEAAVWKAHQNRGYLITQARLPDDAIHWQGEDLTGKTVVVYHEEGSGDFIQFCRFIPKLRELGAKTIRLCGPVANLLELVSDNVAIDDIVPLSGPFCADFVIGSMSVSWRCGVELQHVSGKPYFKAEPADIPRRGKLNVGLVWRGNPSYAQDNRRSLAFSEFCPLFDLPGAAFYSLQAGAPGLEVSQLGLDGFVANLEPVMQTWRDTARLIQALDVVVTVDTAVAHLAGALGKPVFILVTKACDWRWNRQSQKTIWYDSARAIRQKDQDDWAPCIQTVREQLKGMLNERTRQAA